MFFSDIVYCKYACAVQLWGKEHKLSANILQCVIMTRSQEEMLQFIEEHFDIKV
jgi:hypothetical protein